MQVGTVGKRFAAVDRAYLAGFLDADGAIMATIERHAEKRFGYRVRVTVKISQADRFIVDWFHRKSAVGYVRKNRSAYDWVIRDQRIVRDVLEMVMPYLRVKKRQSQQAIAILVTEVTTKRDLLRIARIADALAKRNVRSSGRRKNFAGAVAADLSRND